MDYEYLVLACSRISEESDYVWCKNEEELKEQCYRFDSEHFAIMFAGKVKIEKDLTDTIIKEMISYLTKEE